VFYNLYNISVTGTEIDEELSLPHQELITDICYIWFNLYLNKVLQIFSTAQSSSSVAKHKLLRDTKKQQDNVITSNRAIMTCNTQQEGINKRK
jgi:hypothetical protein